MSKAQSTSSSSTSIENSLYDIIRLQLRGNRRWQADADDIQPLVCDNGTGMVKGNLEAEVAGGSTNGGGKIPSKWCNQCEVEM